MKPDALLDREGKQVNLEERISVDVLNEPIVVDTSENNTNKEGMQVDQEEIITAAGSQSDVLNRPIVVDIASSSAIISTLHENLLPPQLKNSIPIKPKSLISPKNKKRLQAKIKEHESFIDEIHESLVIPISKKKKKTHSKEERMELAKQAINSGNIKNFSEVQGIPYSTLNAWTKKFKLLYQKH